MAEGRRKRGARLGAADGPVNSKWHDVLVGLSSTNASWRLMKLVCSTLDSKTSTIPPHGVCWVLPNSFIDGVSLLWQPHQFCCLIVTLRKERKHFKKNARHVLFALLRFRHSSSIKTWPSHLRSIREEITAGNSWQTKAFTNLRNTATIITMTHEPQQCAPILQYHRPPLSGVFVPCFSPVFTT